MSVSSPIDRLVGLLKWPVAIVCLIFLPGVFYALGFAALGAADRPTTLAPLGLGIVAFVVLWQVYLRARSSRHAVVTFEHELTHAVFALVTLHAVPALGATLSSGGHIRYTGRGNWLVSIAPFIVPMFACIVAVLGHWLHAPEVVAFLLGVTLAWNVVGNWSTAHRHHGDHREVGTIFAFLVIACANALVLGLLLAYVSHAHSLTAHLAHVRGPTTTFFHWLAEMIGKI